MKTSTATSTTAATATTSTTSSTSWVLSGRGLDKLLLTTTTLLLLLGITTTTIISSSSRCSTTTTTRGFSLWWHSNYPRSSFFFFFSSKIKLNMAVQMLRKPKTCDYYYWLIVVRLEFVLLLMLQYNYFVPEDLIRADLWLMLISMLRLSKSEVRIICTIHTFS